MAVLDVVDVIVLGAGSLAAAGNGVDLRPICGFANGLGKFGRCMMNSDEVDVFSRR